MDQELMHRIRKLMDEGHDLYGEGVIDIDIGQRKVFLQEDVFCDLCRDMYVIETLRPYSAYPSSYEAEDGRMMFRCISDKPLDISKCE